MENKVLIIAEAGVNHNGDLDKALKLVDCAAEAGADIVKFQTFTAENLVTKSAEMANYQKNNIGFVESQFEMLKKLELKKEHHYKIIEHCQKRNIRFLSTGFDVESLQFLKTLNMGLWKVPSGELTNIPYLDYLLTTDDLIILSTGMASLIEINETVKYMLSRKKQINPLTVLHCNTDYPTQYADVHLRAMQTIQHELNVPVGYSDHTLGIEVSIAAVALGATVIEKHFTLDRSLKGPDHKASLEPTELKMLVSSIRNVSLSLGRTEKIPTESELKNRAIARKSIVAKTKIQKGEILNDSNITTKRPGLGLSPMKWHEIVGKRAEKDYEEDDMI